MATMVFIHVLVILSVILNLGAWTFKYSHSSLLDYLFFDFFYDCAMPNIRLVALGETRDHIEMHLSFIEKMLYLFPLCPNFGFKPITFPFLLIHMVVHMVNGMFHPFHLGTHPLQHLINVHNFTGGFFPIHSQFRE